MKKRTLREIAREIRLNWARVNYAAEPYLQAMSSLESVSDRYYFDTGRDIVLRFLSNASSWRGESARRIKAELRAMI